MDLASIVEDYLTNYKPELDEDLAYFKRQPDLARAIENAALARLPYGKHPHQRRRKVATLQAAADALLQARSEIRNCTRFDRLYDLGERVTGGIRDFGELCIYDTALRIGAYLGLSPERVYLHAGTRKGVEKLGLDSRAKSLPWTAFPPALAALLGGADLENLLCIYKGSPRTALCRSARAGRSRPPEEAAARGRAHKYGSGLGPARAALRCRVRSLQR
jgi:hypothetical protein